MIGVMDILDNPSVVAQRDPQNVLSFIAKQPEQLRHDFGLTAHDFGTEIRQVVFAGMGGSSLVAELVATFPVLKVPFVICKEYNLPVFVDANTLVICSSYSGNTEETLSALGQAEEAGAEIAIITHGGKLLDAAHAKNYLVAELPETPQPRSSIFFAYRALCEIFVAAKLADVSVLSQLEQLVEPLEAATASWAASVLSGDNLAKQLAGHMVGKTLIVYGGPLTYPVAYKWKIGANENARNTAWCNRLPEFNHNEFMGWGSHPIEKPFAVFDLISSFDHPRVLRRFEVSDRMLSGMRPKAMTVEAQGSSALEHMLYLVLLGDFATTYLGLLNGVNPSLSDMVEKFKVELG